MGDNKLSTLDEALDKVEARFLINLPREELSNMVSGIQFAFTHRVFAHTLYTDYYIPAYDRYVGAVIFPNRTSSLVL
jgi:hypothetical protein